MMLQKSPAQIQALINELKGHLFEYLVGRGLARQFNLEAHFLRSFGGKGKARLREYEDWMRRHDPGLSAVLPAFARQVVQTVLPHLSGEVRGIAVCGKTAGGRTKGVEEGDLLIARNQGTVPISLKLCKADSFVHTKSAGVRSFLAKYFAAPVAQQRLGRLVDNSFAMMGHQLYESVGLEWPGHWDDSWEAAGLPSLPGHLAPSLRGALMQHYRRVISCVHQEMASLGRADPAGFAAALAPLLGFGNAGILQVVCFYRKSASGARASVMVSTCQTGGCRFIPRDERRASFSLEVGPRRLQIRVKPMNRFAVPALKVNCAVKWVAR